jgi:hypothetical protein
VTRAPDARAAHAEVEKALRAQLARVRQRYLLHGVAILVAAALALGAGYYVLDRLLLLPLPVRLLVSAGYAVALILLLRQHLLYPLRRPLASDDIALAIERHHPELHQELISAVQLGRAGGSRDSAALVAVVLDQARERLGRLPLRRLLDDRRTIRLVASTALLIVVAGAGALDHAPAVGVFVRRALGLDASYPRETTLLVELPADGTSHRVERLAAGRARVTMAAGDDLPVLVRVEGRIPRDVELVVTGGRGIPGVVTMSARGADRFRHMFRRVQQGFTFHARGGDDPAGDLEIEIAVVHPPQVASIRAIVEPPPYVGQQPEVQAGGAIEALAGSSVRLEITPTGPATAAAILLVESGRRFELEPRITSDDAGRRELLTTAFVVDRSDRYQVELVGPSGLRNPHPGHYPIVVLPDHPPIGRLLLPLDDALGVALPTGQLPLRVEVRDDYSLRRAEASVTVGKSEQPARIPLLEPQAPIREALVFRLLPVSSLHAADQPAPAIGDTLSLAVELTDNRDPEPQGTKLPARVIHVVAENDLLRRVTSHFRRLRDEVETLEATQRDRAERLAELIQDPPEGDAGVWRADLTLLEVGQARVLDGLGRLRRELARGFDVHLLNGLEPAEASARALELYAEEQAKEPAAETFLPAIYRRLAAERRDGRLGPMEKVLDPLLGMTLAADQAVEGPGPAAVAAITRAQVAPGSSARLDALVRAQEYQREILQVLADLRARLDEWNEFQDVIAQTRMLLDRQRDVQSRTRLLDGEKK